jgi:pilus assembly protein Flp/PilA
MLVNFIIMWLRHLLLTTRIQSRKVVEGQGLVEYALILVLVAVAVIVVLMLLGPAIGNVFSNIVCMVTNVNPTGSCG